MSTSFDITGRINAVVSSGSLRMLKKLQTELRQTAKTLLKMGEDTTASALGHTAMALDRVAAASGDAAGGAKKLAASTGVVAEKVSKLKNVSKEQADIAEKVSEGWKLSGGEARGLTKAVGLLGKKYTYAADAQREWVPALRSALTGINKQKVALVASGKAITAHVSSTELFDRVNRKLALGTDKVKSSFTDYGKAMEKSLGRSTAFRAETTKLAKSFGVQGEAFNKQFAALTKVDNVWREHVTTMHRAGKITTAQAHKMYSSYAHLGVGAKELQTRIKASNGELVNAATYNKAARKELDQHTKSMAKINVAEEKLAATTGKSMSAIRGETEALMKKTKSVDAVVAGINKQTNAHKTLTKDIAAVSKQEQILARVTGAKIGKIQEITKRMRAQGVSYADIGSRLKSLTSKYSTSTTAMGRVAVASDKLRRTNKNLAGEIDALGRMKVKNLAATNKTAAGIVSLTRKYPTLGSEVAKLTGKIASGNMTLATADKLLGQTRAGMGKTTGKASLLGRAMSSLVSHLKSFASYAAAASIIGGIAAMFGSAINAVIKYDQALHDLQAITRATDADVALMGEKIREIGRTTKFSASEVAVAMRTLGQAGFTASEAVASIGAVANLATGTLTSMKVVVDLVTTAIRAFDLKATEMTRVSDVFANAVNRSKLTIDKLRIAFNYIGPIAAKTGISLEETATTTMMLANAGIRASTIGTGLRRTFQQLIDPTKELQTAIAAAGYTVEDFNPQMNDMRDIIRRLTEIVPDAESAFRMFSLRSSAAVAALSSQGVSSFDALHSAVLRTGTAAEMAEKQIEGLGIVFKQAWDKAQDLALAFGEAGLTKVLWVLGKGLQGLFDGLRIFISSGIGKAIIAVASLAAGMLVLGKIWVAIKMSSWATAVGVFVIQMWEAVVAVEGLSGALLLLQKRGSLIIIALAALYGAYKLYSSVLMKVEEVNTDYIDTLDKVHREELKRLESIKQLVSIARDETENNRERSRALVELAKKGVVLNLTFEEGTEQIENHTDAVLDNKEALDGAAQSFGDYSEKARMEKLEAQIKLFENIDVAIKKTTSSMNYWGKQSEKFISGTAQGLAKIPILGGLVSGAFLLMRKRVDGCRKGVKKLEAEQKEAYERMAKEVASFGEITQEVWKTYMLNAGASEKEVAKLFTDGKEKITRAHVDAYKRIQDARKDMTEAEKAESERHIKIFGDLFDKLNNTTARRLEKDLRAVREHYSEREKVVTEFYKSDMLYLKGKLGTEKEVYEKLLGLIKRQMITKLSLMKQQYADEKALIVNQRMGMVEEQEKISELDKKFANRKLALEKETAASIVLLAEEQLGVLAEIYDRTATAYDKSVDRRIDAINRCYDYEKTKLELQGEGAKTALSDAAQYAERRVAIEASSSLRRIGIENEYVLKKKNAANALYWLEKELAEKVVALEAQRFNELMALSEQAKDGRLANEEAYHAEQLRLVELAQETMALQYEEGDEERVKKEEELNDKLVELNRESAEKRLEILNKWADDLSSKYDEAVENTRKYANEVISIENEIRDIRKKAAEEIVSVTASTEAQLLRIRRAGMTETQVLRSKMSEAHRKMAEADRLVSEVGTAEALKQAKVLYGEAQGIYADLGVKAASAAKEGKNIGITHQGAAKAVQIAGQAIINVLKKEEEASIAAKQAELTVAKQAQKSWSDLAEEIKERVKDIQTDISELTGAVKGLVSTIDAVEDKEVTVEANEERLKNSIRLVKDLWTNICELEDKEIVITTRHEEAAQAGGPIGLTRSGKLPGFGGGDKVNALLEAGEFIINKESVKKYGTSFFNLLNQGLHPVTQALGFRLGGPVGKPAKAGGTAGRTFKGGGQTFSFLEEAVATLVNSIKHIDSICVSLMRPYPTVMGSASFLNPDPLFKAMPVARIAVAEAKAQVKGEVARADAILKSEGMSLDDVNIDIPEIPEAGQAEAVSIDVDSVKQELASVMAEIEEVKNDLAKVKQFFKDVTLIKKKIEAALKFGDFMVIKNLIELLSTDTERITLPVDDIKEALTTMSTFKEQVVSNEGRGKVHAGSPIGKGHYTFSHYPKAREKYYDAQTKVESMIKSGKEGIGPDLSKELRGTVGSNQDSIDDIAKSIIEEFKYDKFKIDLSSLARAVENVSSGAPSEVSKRTFWFEEGGPVATAAAAIRKGGATLRKHIGDTVPAMLTPGEFVLNKRAAQSLGAGLLNKLNRFGADVFAPTPISALPPISAFAEGGPVGAIKETERITDTHKIQFDFGGEKSYTGTFPSKVARNLVSELRRAGLGTS